MRRLISLRMEFSILGTNETIHPVVLQDQDNIILIDCGFVGSLNALEEELLKHHIKPASITHLVITHHDHDHMGTAAEMKRKYPSILIVASALESNYICGREKSMRLTQAEALQQSLPEEHKIFGEKFCEVLRSVKPVEVDLQVQDGDTFDWCGGCTIIATPGHTPGHISILNKSNNAIIAGDAAAIEGGKLVLANPHFTLDLENANQSLHRIKNAGVDTIFCYHGGIYKC